MYVPEKGKKLPVHEAGAVDLELGAVLRLEARRSARSNKATITSRLPRVGPPGGDNSLFTEESVAEGRSSLLTGQRNL